MKTQFRYRKEQVEFGWGKPQREEILNDIHKQNKKLEKLLEKSDKITKSKNSTTVAAPPKTVKSLLRYWQHADRIYALIHHSWGCQCKDKHCAHLWLQHRTSPTFEFKLLVLWAPKAVQGHALPPWDRQGLQITRLNSETMRAQPSSVPTRKGVPKEICSTPTAISVPANKDKKRRVVFADFQ